MKKTLLFTLLTLFGMTQLAAQEYEYVPFVREGVKWVYFYSNPIQGLGYEDGFIPYGEHYYTFEMKGDTLIDGKSYKPVHLYSGTDINDASDTVPVFLREENKIVYGIIPDDRRYWECPIGIGTMVLDLRLISSVKTREEFILYDFNDPATFYGTTPDAYGYDHADTVQIGSHLSKRLQFGYNDDYIIEGIGFVGNDVGTPLNYFYAVTTGLTQVVNHLSHVIEDGEIIYKTEWYNESDPSDYEYVPFVREGVKWVYVCKNPYWVEEFWGNEYYSFEFKSDVKIGDKYYKPVCLTRFLDKDGANKEVMDFTPVYLREENKVVYAILPDGILHPQCPVGMFNYIGYPYDDSPITIPNQEFRLYDFNDPMSLYEGFVEYNGLNYEMIGGHKSKCHHYTWYYGDNEVIIEGIGYDGAAGMPLFYFEYFITGMQVTYYLSHVIEDGEIIYKGIHYNPDVHVGIDEMVSEQSRRAWNGNYFNLMGQSMGTEVPTTSGIYIHQGKKIVVR